MAFAIHQGNPQSTTTIGLSLDQGRMFATSQGNTTYSTNPSTYTDILDALVKLLTGMTHKKAEVKPGKPRLTLEEAS